jgi:hypothetical protein
LTGRLAVCAGSCGPGHLHLINGLDAAHRSRVPVLALAAHIPSRELGRGYFQETPPEQLFRECSHYCELVSHPEQMPRVLEIAVQTAVSRRGVSVVVLPGDTEEWTVVNSDQQYHSVHLHQTAFLVTEVNGVCQHEDSLRDTFWVPPATDNGPGVLKVVIPFTDPVIVGRFVYHCHAVNHEDKGMMGIVEVVA